MSGVTVERNSSGEGQYAILRGMDKRYNYTLVNGVKIPSPDNKNRFVPLDIFPSEMLDRLEAVSYTHLDVYKRQDPASAILLCFYPYTENEGAVVLWCGECVSYLWFDWPVGGTLRSGRGLHESFVPKEEMVWFACCVFGWGVVGLYRYSFGYRYSVDRRDLFGKVSGVPVAAGFLCLFYLDPFCRLASDSVCNGLYDEGSSQRKALGESICCGKLVGRPVLLFRILSARTV